MRRKLLKVEVVTGNRRDVGGGMDQIHDVDLEDVEGFGLLDHAPEEDDEVGYQADCIVSVHRTLQQLEILTDSENEEKASPASRFVDSNASEERLSPRGLVLHERHDCSFADSTLALTKQYNTAQSKTDKGRRHPFMFLSPHVALPPGPISGIVHVVALPSTSRLVLKRRRWTGRRLGRSKTPPTRRLRGSETAAGPRLDTRLQGWTHFYGSSSLYRSWVLLCFDVIWRLAASRPLSLALLVVRLEMQIRLC